MTSWFELRMDGVWVCRFEYYTSSEYASAKKKVFRDLELQRNGSGRDKVLQIFEVWRVQTRNEKGQVSFLLDGKREKLIHEEHPTVIEAEPNTRTGKYATPYDLLVM